MEYTNQLIAKAKHSRCRICLEYITEPEADNQEFQAAKTSRGGVQLCTYQVLGERI
ncbi:MAG: hypothetical protein K0R34_2875 [Herbinix sp.]|jgi:hypothetical protein|nr:hypothetical protein [Herbinix sp.]